MKIYPTHMDRYFDCPRKYWYQNVARWKKRAQAATLLIGILLHECVRKYVRADTLGTTYDPVGDFISTWRTMLAEQEVEFNTKQTGEALEASGTRMMELLPQAWADMELIPIIDSDGEPFLERELEARISNNVTLAARIDGVFMSKRDGSVGPKDFKFSTKIFEPIATLQSDQLTLQQIVCEANVERLGLETIDNVGFIEGVRRDVPKKKKGSGKGPGFIPPSIVPIRTPEEIREFKNKALRMAAEVQQGRFIKTPRQPHNTPCSMCDFVNHCVHGSTAGLIIPPQQQLELPAA